MVTLEQVRLLESKVVKALSYIETLSAENATLREKLDGYKSRIDELETVVLAFKEDQGRIEAGIISALERLNQFEDAVEHGILKTKAAENADTAVEPAYVQPADSSVEVSDSDSEAASTDPEVVSTEPEASAAELEESPSSEGVEEPESGGLKTRTVNWIFSRNL
jgi:peptidoglycan hydrolase CwlO-like protein